MNHRHWFTAALLCVTAAGCAADPAPPTAASSTAAADATEENVESVAAPLPSSSAATSADQLGVLSGEKPAEPKASASASLSDARAAQIANELQSLDIALLGSLNSAGTATDRVLRDGDINHQLLNDAAASGAGAGGRGRVGDLSAGRGGDVRLGTGGGGNLAGIGSKGEGSGPGSASGLKSSSIAGKPGKDLTTSDVDKALGKAGCSTTRVDSPSQPPTPGTAFEAKCADDKTFIVSFVPAGGTLPDSKAVAELDRLGTTWKEDGAFLAIVPKAKATRADCIALLSKLRSDSSPKGSAAIGGASVSGGSVSNAGAVVAGMAAGMRRCYARGLKEDPEMKGSMRVTAKIGPNGEVTSASPSGGGGLSGTVISCVAGVVSSRNFASPEGGEATIVIPVSFMPQ